MYQRILVPVDGSPTSIRGLEEGIRIAKLTGGALHLVHVLDAPNLLGLDAYPDVLAAIREAGVRVIDRMKARAGAAGVQVTTFMSELFAGRVCDIVAEQARAFGADLIVLGSHGRRGVGRMLLGSDAERILRLAPVPVLLIRATGGATPTDSATESRREEAPNRSPYRSILVPVDGSATSMAGVSEAIRLARLTGGEIRLVHVLDPWLYANGFEAPATYCNEVLPAMRRDGARILDEARAPVVAAGRAVTSTLIEQLAERISDMLLREARQWNADLIVIGSHGRRGWDRTFMGSEAEQVLRRSPVPVLVVRDAAGRPQLLPSNATPTRPSA